MPSPARLTAMLILAGSLSACATARTLPQVSERSSWMYSGTRLNVAALSGDQVALSDYWARGIDPPAYPGLDLPLSLMADTAVFVGVATGDLLTRYRSPGLGADAP